MRIFYASDTTPNADLNSNLWRNNLLLPLRDLGHDVIEFAYDLRETFQHLNTSDPKQLEFINSNRPKVTDALLAQITNAHADKPVDLLFTYFYDACIDPSAIDQIRGMGIKAINWYCNGSYQLHLVEQISPHYDWCLVPEKFRMDDYRKMGAHPIYCQEAANPDIYKRYDVPVEYDVTFVGQAYGERPEYIKGLLDRGIDVRVWGPRWQQYTKPSLVRQAARLVRSIADPSQPVQTVIPDSIIGLPLSDEEMVRMYSRSRINLGFSSVGNTHREKERILQVRLRDFEVPMSGGFYMVEYMEELEEFFVIGKEIVCYSGLDDLASKIKYYLANENERESIRLAGYERAQRDHTWHKRFQTVFDETGLSNMAPTPEGRQTVAV